MIERLSPRVRKWVLNGIIVFAIMLLVFGFIRGKSLENEQDTGTNDGKANVEEGFSYSDINNPDSIGNDSNSLQPQTNRRKDMAMDSYEDDPNITEVSGEREVNVLADFFSESEINRAKEVSKQFVKSHYQFNGDQPNEHIEKASQFVTDDLKAKMTTNLIVRPTNDNYRRRIVGLEVYESYNPTSKEFLNLIARVKGEVLNIEGEITKREMVEYDLKLVPFEDTFRINEYTYKSLNYKEQGKE